MEHQITIIGGQITPVYWGIKEKNPDVVHILYTKESRIHVPILEHLFSHIKFYSYQVSPYDFTEIKDTVEEIIFEYPEQNFELNLTGGTKVMALASQNTFNSLGLKSFYIDQNSRIFNFSTNEYLQIQTKIKTDTFIRLSGHKKYSAKSLKDYTTKEISFSFLINSISNSNAFTKIIKVIRANVRKIDSCPKYSVTNESYKLSWNAPYFKLKIGDNNINIESHNAFRIAFGGLWWELLAASAIKGWNRIYEMHLGLELFSKSEVQNTKNEIDIVINTGKNLIFLECKSGMVKQEDVNKIRAVKRLYGGISSRSILVCKYNPRPDIIEKCNDLGIAIYFEKNLDQLPRRLNSLLLKMEL